MRLADVWHSDKHLYHKKTEMNGAQDKQWISMQNYKNVH